MSTPAATAPAAPLTTSRVACSQPAAATLIRAVAAMLIGALLVVVGSAAGSDQVPNGERINFAANFFKCADAEKAKPKLEIEGCTSASAAGASIATKAVRVSSKGIAKFKLKCNDKAKACKGRLSLADGIGSKSFKIKTNKAGLVKLKVTKKGMKKLRKHKRLKTRATAKVGSKTTRKSVTLVAPKKKRHKK